MEELDHSWFVFDKHQIEFETLDSKSTKGVMKIISAEFIQDKDQFTEATQYKNKCPMPTGRQIMFQIFSFFNINKSSRAHGMDSILSFVAEWVFHEKWVGSHLAACMWIYTKAV